MDCCRLCLCTDSQQFFNIYSKPEPADPIESCWSEVIRKLFGIDMQHDSELPSQICQVCKSKVEDFEKYHDQVSRAQTELLRRLKECQKKVRQKPEATLVECQPSKRKKTSLEFSSGKRTAKALKRDQQRKEDQIIKNFFGLDCKLCPVAPFDNLYHLREHARSAHSITVLTIECCSKVLKKRGQLLSHALRHIDPEGQRCKQCGKQTKNMKMHVLQHHSLESLKQHSCHDCPKRFRTAAGLKAHSLKHLSSEQRNQLKTHTCPECGFAFISKSILAHHVRQIHQDVYACICDICARHFKSKTQFLNHYQSIHSDPEANRVQCSKCDKWLAGAISLKKHLKLAHEPGPHICDKCGKETPTKHALIAHIRYMHKMAPKFVCSYCPKAFKMSVHLREHLTTHVEGGALYTCPYCERSFNSGANMYSHKKKMHPLEWARSKQKP